jgi:hypothetical protein
MASHPVTLSVKQHCIIGFLVKYKVKLAEFLRRLSVQYGEDTFSCAHMQLTAVTDVNIHHIEELILENRRIAVRDIASEVCISVGSVETIIHEHLLFKKVCA